MSEPVPFVAFASPDGSGWGLALGGGQTLDPELEPELTGEITPLLAATDPGLAAATPATVGGAPALTGTVPNPRDGDSLRLAVALFDHGRALGLSALRPRRARGHDRDVIEAVVYEDGASPPVDDPRLSVTLGAGGVPQRVGLELWLAPAEDEGYDFPRRAAGEILQPALELGLDEFRATAHRVRWRSRGEDGSGWFVLMRAQ